MQDVQKSLRPIWLDDANGEVNVIDQRSLPHELVVLELQTVDDTIYAIQEVYRLIYQRGLNISDALEFVEANLPASKERDEIILFIRESKRGIIRGYFDGKDS